MKKQILYLLNLLSLLKIVFLLLNEVPMKILLINKNKGYLYFINKKKKATIRI